MKVTGAHRSDQEGARALLSPLTDCFPRLELVWGDSHYGGQFVTWMKVNMGWRMQTVKALTVPKRGLLVPEGEEIDWDKLFPSGFRPLPRRWVVERTFSLLVRFRRLCRDHEGLPESSEAFIMLAASTRMLARLAPHLSEVAIQQARERARRWGLSPHARFLVANAIRTTCSEATFDAAVSIDAVQMFFQYTAALMKEMARLIRPGGRFVIFTWNERTSDEFTSIERALQGADFAIEAREEMTDWQRYQHTIYDRTILAVDAFVKEMGHAVAQALLDEARRSCAQLSKTQRIFLVACRMQI